MPWAREEEPRDPPPGCLALALVDLTRGVSIDMRVFDPARAGLLESAAAAVADLLPWPGNAPGVEAVVLAHDVVILARRLSGDRALVAVCEPPPPDKLVEEGWRGVAEALRRG